MAKYIIRALLIALSLFVFSFFGCFNKEYIPVALTDEEKNAIKNDALESYNASLSKIGFQMVSEPLETMHENQIYYPTFSPLSFDKFEVVFADCAVNKIIAKFVNCGSERFVNSDTGDELTLIVLKTISIFYNTTSINTGDIIVAVNYHPYAGQVKNCPKGEVIGYLSAFTEYRYLQQDDIHIKNALLDVWSISAVSTERNEGTNDIIIFHRDEILEKYLK